MLLRSEQLQQHLDKSLAPIYFVSGDEPLLVDEACRAIRNCAKAQGYTEVEKHSVNQHFNWEVLDTAKTLLSMFCEKTFLELRFESNKIGIKGSKALKQYTENPNDKQLILIIGPKLEANIKSSAWCKAIDKIGVLVQIWPIELNRLPQWLTTRALSYGLKLNRDSARLIAERTEGNLLAANQTLEKLQLILGEGEVPLAECEQVLADHTQHNLFTIADCVLEGNIKRTMQIFTNLKSQGEDPILILWLLCKELRSLVNIAAEMANGIPIYQLMEQHRIWQKRRPLVQRALQRHSLTDLQQMLQWAQSIDQIIKGQQAGNFWDELQQLYLWLAGYKCLSPLS